jgi:hypothetical protein
MKPCVSSNWSNSLRIRRMEDRLSLEKEVLPRMGWVGGRCEAPISVSVRMKVEQCDDRPERLAHNPNAIPERTILA